MRLSGPTALLLLTLTVSGWPVPGSAQSDRDFVFTDEEGHLVIRFTGTGPTGLDSAQRYEILNAEFSSMVHDRLHADIQFAAEPHDPEWAAVMEPEIAGHARHAGPEFSSVIVECRAVSCRIILEQPGHWSDVEQHRSVLATVQGSLDTFIRSNPEQFEPGFMITAYYQISESSHIKAFLRRVANGKTEE